MARKDRGRWFEGLGNHYLIRCELNDAEEFFKSIGEDITQYRRMTDEEVEKMHLFEYDADSKYWRNEE